MRKEELEMIHSQMEPWFSALRLLLTSVYGCSYCSWIKIAAVGTSHNGAHNGCPAGIWEVISKHP